MSRKKKDFANIFQERNFITLMFAIYLICLSGNIWSSETEFNTVDKLAFRILNTLQEKSFEDKVEYCGVIGYDQNGALVASKAVKGTEDYCNLDQGTIIEIVASYHTHGAFDYFISDTEVPSMEDLLGDFEDEIDGYVSTPGGRFWVNRFEDSVTYMLCGPYCMKVDPNFFECAPLIPKQNYTVEEMRFRFENDDFDC